MIGQILINNILLFYSGRFCVFILCGSILRIGHLLHDFVIRRNIDLFLCAGLSCSSINTFYSWGDRNTIESSLNIFSYFRQLIWSNICHDSNVIKPSFNLSFQRGDTIVADRSYYINRNLLFSSRTCINGSGLFALFCMLCRSSRGRNRCAFQL